MTAGVRWVECLPCAMWVALSPSRAHIEWQAPPECPDAATVDASAETLLHQGDGEVVARAVVHRTAAGEYLLEVTTNDGLSLVDPGVHADDCRTLAELTALAVALHAAPSATAPVDPDLRPAEVKTEPEAESDPTPSETEPAPTATPLPPSLPQSEVSPGPVEAEPTWNGSLGVRGFVGRAQVPVLDAGIGIALAVGGSRWRTTLQLTRVFTRSMPIPGTSTARASLASWNTALGVCSVFGRIRLKGLLCAGIELGAVVARAQGVRSSQTATDLWVAALVTPAVEWRPAPSIGVQLALELVAAVRRPSFRVRDEGTGVALTNAGGARAILGLAWHFTAPHRRR